MDNITCTTNHAQSPLPRTGEIHTPQLASQERRQLVYHWLANLFATELTVEIIAHYGSPEGMAFLALIGEQSGLEPLVARLSDLAGGPDEAESTAMTLAGSFARLFLGAGGRCSAPPYQSAYLGKNPRLYQAPVAQMDEILRLLNMSLPSDFREPADHISVQLNVMADLVGRGNVNQQMDFLDRHLVCWLAEFAAACQQHDRIGFYAAAASGLADWLKADQAALTEAQHRSVG